MMMIMMIKIHQVVKVNCHATSYYQGDAIISTLHVEGDLNQEKKGLYSIHIFSISISPKIQLCLPN